MKKVILLAACVAALSSCYSAKVIIKDSDSAQVSTIQKRDSSTISTNLNVTFNPLNSK